jgi:exportin-1
MRSAKKEVLRLLVVFIEKSGPPEADPQAVAQGFIPPVLDPILGDYQRNIPNARDPEVLTLFTTVVEKLKGHILSDVPRIMDAVFECTLQMITANFEDFPEHRLRFFEFIRVSTLIKEALCTVSTRSCNSHDFHPTHALFLSLSRRLSTHTVSKLFSTSHPSIRSLWLIQLFGQ